jgi:hypothetical protein
MLQSIEEKASNYASSLQTLETEILKDVKKLKACKQQRMKKFFDRVSFLQKEVEGSVSEVRPKSIYRSCGGSHFYGTEYEIWADFGPVGNTEKKIGGLNF